MRLSMTMTQEDITDLIRQAAKAGLLPVPANHALISFDFVSDDVGEFELVIELHRLLEEISTTEEPADRADSMRL